MITGRTIKLENDRSVFVGRRTGRDNANYVEFRNGSSCKRFVLSDPALEALAELIGGTVRGEATEYPVQPGDERMEWQIVKPINA